MAQLRSVSGMRRQPQPDIGLGTPARMIKLTEQRKISRYVWVHLDEER
jgi:hypothetical protein